MHGLLDAAQAGGAQESEVQVTPQDVHRNLVGGLGVYINPARFVLGRARVPFIVTDPRPNSHGVYGGLVWVGSGEAGCWRRSWTSAADLDVAIYHEHPAWKLLTTMHAHGDVVVGSDVVKIEDDAVAPLAHHPVGDDGVFGVVTHVRPNGDAIVAWTRRAHVSPDGSFTFL